MYAGIKKENGSTVARITPLKSMTSEIISDHNKQLEFWMEYYPELYATKNLVLNVALEDILALPIMEEPDMLPTLKELNKAIDCLTCGKSAWKDGIPLEIVKSRNPVLLQHPYKLICLCGEKGKVLKDMHDTTIIT